MLTERGRAEIGRTMRDAGHLRAAPIAEEAIALAGRHDMPVVDATYDALEHSARYGETLAGLTATALRDILAHPKSSYAASLAAAKLLVRAATKKPGKRYEDAEAEIRARITGVAGRIIEVVADERRGPEYFRAHTQHDLRLIHNLR